MSGWKDRFKTQIESAKNEYLADLKALSHEQLDQSPGGSARAPYDFTFEVLTINHRIAHRLRGEDPGPWQFEGWLKCPPELRHKEVIESKFAESMDVVLVALEGLDEASLLDKSKSHDGKSSFAEMLDIIVLHATYHDGQLNQVQAIGGDTEVHWNW